MRLGLLQYRVTRIESFAAFEGKLDRLVAAGAAGAEFLIMPEYACMEVASAFMTGPGSAQDELAAVCGQARRLLEAMRVAAIRHRVWLLPGSLPWPGGDGGVRNRAPLIGPDGSVAFQDKRVMTRFEAEEWGVQAGGAPSVFETPWGRIGIAICYDVEFPTLVRAQVAAGAWLIVTPSCTDTEHGFNRVRISAQARALENQVYVAIAPTVGAAPWLAALDCNRGYAAVFGPVDRGFPPDGMLAQGVMDAEQWVFAELDPARLAAVRTDGAVRNHRDWPDVVPAAPVVTLERVPA